MATVLLRRAGVAVLLATDDDGSTAVVHWGADLGDLDADEQATVAAMTLPPAPHSALDRPVRVGLVPGGARG